MENIIKFPQPDKSKKVRKLLKLMFCRNCLKKRCPDISNKTSGAVAMLIPILDEQNNPFHAYVTINVIDLKGIFAANATEKFVDLAEYATIHFISEGFEPQSDFLVGYFKEGNSSNIEILH